MSLYNMIHGYNPACLVFLPMLGRQYHEYPRFRDCFVSEDEKNILILLRVGGNNRNNGFEEDFLYKDKHFIRTYDADFDETYGFYEFSVPERWKADFEAILSNGIKAMSAEYLKYLLDFHKDKPQIVERLMEIAQEIKDNCEACVVKENEA